MWRFSHILSQTDRTQQTITVPDGGRKRTTLRTGVANRIYNEASLPPDTWTIFQAISSNLSSRKQQCKNKQKCCQVGMKWFGQKIGNKPAKLLLQISHVLMTLCIVDRLGLNEVVQTVQVMRLQPGVTDTIQIRNNSNNTNYINQSIKWSPTDQSIAELISVKKLNIKQWNQTKDELCSQNDNHYTALPARNPTVLTSLSSKAKHCTGCPLFSTLIFHDFSMTKKWKSMTYRHNIYFQVNYIRLMNAYQN